MTCKHNMGPPGYVERAEWAEKKLKTHEQKQCPKCGLWALWTKRKTMTLEDDAWPPNPAWLIEHGSPAAYFCGDGDWCSNPNHAYRFVTKDVATAKAETMPIEGIRVAEHLWQ